MAKGKTKGAWHLLGLGIGRETSNIICFFFLVLRCFCSILGVIVRNGTHLAIRIVCNLNSFGSNVSLIGNFDFFVIF